MTLDVRAQAEALREKALPLLSTGAFAEALALYDEALVLARQTRDDVFVDWIYACRAAAAVESGGADEVLVELKRVLLRTSDAATAFRASYSAARVYELRRDFKKALFYNRIARQHASRLDDVLLFAGAEKQGGTFLTLESRFDDAAEAYRHALELTAPPAPVPEIFRALLKDELGYCLISLDRTEEGLALVHESLDTLEREGAGQSPNVAYLLMDLCFGYLKLDRYAEARY
ncbi:MAG TPA: hypothetical protein VGR00_06695, partial [Thermoanaerobaculia bacterium]|nr:hypothetical protein [Thermoanaerobaculia bacterium]